ncbi:MAG TPA: GNAT family N-acetyltransferase [Terracidiphilus sp.]|nr:GNAT family N-acetyltransferase [Terracidiphilus sp.]
MTNPVDLHSARLILRLWRASDREPFAQMNADPRVMQHYPSLLTSDQSDALVDRIEAHFARHGFGLWAAELRDTGEFIGYIGLSVPTFTAHFTSTENPAVEIGWRLAAEHWGHGLATEGAQAILVHAFTVLNLDEIVSFTTPGNIASRRVMEKLGMTRNPAEDFDHPNLPESHPLRRHVLYRITRPVCS